MFKMHWEEVGHNGGPSKFELDSDLYQDIEGLGRLISFIVKYEEKLIGYCTSYLFNHSHYKGTLFAATDSFYIEPQYRNGFVFKRLINTMSFTLKDKYKVKYFQIGVNVNNDITKLMQKLNFVLSSKILTKEL